MGLRVIVFLSFLVFCESSKIPQSVDRENEARGNRIVGGSATDILNYPYQVSLQWYYRHICGGAIISSRWVLSAAHCTVLDYNVESPRFAYTVRVGSSFVMAEGLVMGVSRIVDHHGYGNSDHWIDYDITLIQLSSELTFSNRIQPVRLPSPNQQEIPGAPCVITGWGALTQGGSSPSRLHVVTTPWISNESCNEYYRPTTITHTMMCSGSPYGGRDACQGDSGGPLVVNGTLMGIVSWGAGCAQPGFPGVYAYTVAVREWISDTTGV